MLKSDLMHGLGNEIENKLDRDNFQLNINNDKYHFINLFNDSNHVRNYFNNIQSYDEVLLYSPFGKKSVYELFSEFVIENRINIRSSTIRYLYLKISKDDDNCIVC